MDIADVRDSQMAAQMMVEQVIAETVSKFYKPDLELRLAMEVATMPDEGWQMMDQETKDSIVEVLHGK